MWAIDKRNTTISVGTPDQYHCETQMILFSRFLWILLPRIAWRRRIYSWRTSSHHWECLANQIWQRIGGRTVGPENWSAKEYQGNEIGWNEDSGIRVVSHWNGWVPLVGISDLSWFLYRSDWSYTPAHGQAISALGPERSGVHRPSALHTNIQCRQKHIRGISAG